MEIEPCKLGHLFRMIQDSQHYKAGDLVFTTDFTGMIPLTTDGAPLDPAIVSISGDEGASSNFPEDVHIEMLQYVGPAQ